MITDPAVFELWWQRRSLPGDRDLVQQAIAAGLVSREAGLLFLTKSGKALRRTGEKLRGVVPRKQRA